MKKFKSLSLIFMMSLVMSVLVGCSSESEPVDLVSQSNESVSKEAMDLFDQGKSSVTFNPGGSMDIDDLINTLEIPGYEFDSAFPMKGGDSTREYADSYYVTYKKVEGTSDEK